jgi:hypothetical protein
MLIGGESASSKKYTSMVRANAAASAWSNITLPVVSIRVRQRFETPYA